MRLDRPPHWELGVNVRRFLLMPDLGRGDGVEDEKRSDSLDDFPRVVETRGERKSRERARKR